MINTTNRTLISVTAAKLVYGLKVDKDNSLKVMDEVKKNNPDVKWDIPIEEHDESIQFAIWYAACKEAEKSIYHQPI